MKATGSTAVERLLSISSDPLVPTPEVKPKLLESYPLGEELFHLLQAKNGFYAFESALHVFPLSSTDCMSLESWNSESLWRNGYGDLARGLLFFAEDVFQDQFCLSAEGISRFYSECGETSAIAVSIEDWAQKLMRDYEYETGWPLACEWQARNGPLPLDRRLMPKIPFFIGGGYSLDNLWAGEAVEGMRFKADFASQTKHLPEGTRVRLRVGTKTESQ